MIKKFQYETNCINCRDGDAINEMVNVSKEVTLKTLLKNCFGIKEWAKEKGYDSLCGKNGLSLKHDRGVSFRKSKFGGKQCYYICWSCIEYIWTAASL